MPYDFFIYNDPFRAKNKIIRINWKERRWIEKFSPSSDGARFINKPLDHIFLTGGYTANTSLSMFCRDNGLLLHIHRAMHAVIDRQRNHGIHFRVLAKTLRMSGGDHLHSGTVVGKLEGEREVTLGFVDLMRDPYVELRNERFWY